MSKKIISIILIGLSIFVFAFSTNAQIIREKQAIIQKAFPNNNNNGTPANDTTGSVWPEFGDLFFEKNGKDYWLTTFTQIVGPTKEYYRLFELKIDSGFIREVTNDQLGGFFEVGGPNPPYYYTDLDNDGIKDLIVIDHGKEADPDFKKWGDYNVFFKGTSLGFKKTEIIGLTDTKGYYHGHDIADFDNDGDLDIAVSGSFIGVKVFKNEGGGQFKQMQVGTARGNFAPLSLKFINTDNDPELEILGPPYRDFFLNGKPQAQSYLLNLNNNSWEVGNFAQIGPFENGELWGNAQILLFNSKTREKPDILFRVEGQLNPTSRWYSKYYSNDLIKFDTIFPLKSAYLDTSLFNYTDPKKVDINFDGNDDLVFKEYNYGGTLHPLNEKIWINDGKNRFNPSNIKFDSLLSKQMYLYVKKDTIKKYHLYMTVNEQYNNNYSTKVIYNRFDSLVFPINTEFNVKLCEGETNKTQLIKVPIGMIIVKQAQKGKITIADSTATYTANIIGTDTVSFKLKNDFFESPEYRIIYNNIAKPTTPTISRDTANNLVSSAVNAKWYKDGTAISDTTQKIKPSSAGSYTVSTNQNGCSSIQSAAYYYLVTDIINLSIDEFIKLAPNPFQGILHFDFNIRGIQKLNIEVFDIITGAKLITIQDQRAGQSLDFSQLNPGTFIIRVSSRDNKIDHKFKLVKM
ncbi:MAG: hypothetical protein RL158_22 [Bacteroidota bacterium]